MSNDVKKGSTRSHKKQKVDKRRVMFSVVAGVMVLCMVIPMISMIFTYM